jgi:excisionase family DNA binding protein
MGATAATGQQRVTRETQRTPRKGVARTMNDYQTTAVVKPTAMRKLLLTVPEAAEALGICRSVVYERMASGELPNIKIGRARRIPTSMLETFVARRLGHELPRSSAESESTETAETSEVR